MSLTGMGQPAQQPVGQQNSLWIPLAFSDAEIKGIIRDFPLAPSDVARQSALGMVSNGFHWKFPMESMTKSKTELAFGYPRPV
jgi:hypothetical protein